MDYSELYPEIEALATKLDKMGLALCIIRKPRPFHYRDIGVFRYGKTNVKERRKAMGVNITTLAKMMGVAPIIVSRMENPEVTHTKASMQRFADYFGCTIDELLDTSPDY